MAKEYTHREISWSIRDLIDSNISNIQMLILHTALACTDQNFEFHYGATNFGHICRCSRSTIQANMKKLINSKYILLIKKGGKGGKDGSRGCKNPNHYRLNVEHIMNNSNYKNSPTKRLFDEQKLNGIAREKSQNSPGAGPKAYKEAYGKTRATSQRGLPINEKINTEPIKEQTMEEFKAELMERIKPPYEARK